MEDRRWIFVLALSCLICSGCLVQEQDKITGVTTPPKLVWPWQTKPEKRIPEPETVLAFGKLSEEDARKAPGLSQWERDHKLENARVAYKSVLAKEPDNIDARLGLAGVYASLHDSERALAAYEEGLKKFPKDVRLWVGKGKFHCQQKEYSQAVQCFHKAHDLQPEDRDITSTLAYTLVLANQIPESVRLFGHLYGSEAKAHYRIALMMTWLQRWDDARRQALIAMQKDPTLMVAREMVAHLEQGPPNLTAQPTPDNATLQITFPPASQPQQPVVP